MAQITRRTFIAGAGAALAAGAVVSTSLTAIAAESTTFTPGTYTATAPGRNGDITVSVTFGENEIEDIVADHAETPTIGGSAIEQLSTQIVAQQALDVEVISGATMSSDALLTAVADCVVQAGGDPATLTGATSQAEEYITEGDVIVVGAGGAGMSAAITAAELGANVILLEKSGVVGGNSLMTMNGINAVDSSIQLADQNYVDEAPEGGFKDLTMTLAPDASEPMVDAYVANSGDLIDWLSEKGLEFEVTFSEDPRNNAMNYWLLMGGDSFETAPRVIGALEDERKTLDNVHLYLNTAATSLVTDDSGAVTGVVAQTPQGEITFSAHSVILTTGGFNADKDMVVSVRPDLANAVIGVRAPTTGDGLLMAEEIGAASLNLDVMNTFPNFMDGYGMVMMWVLPGGQDIDCIYVDQDAQRFSKEAFRADVNALLANERSYTIFDESGMNDNLRAALEAGVVKTAETPQELGELLGIDGEALAATIDAFNEDMADGVDDVFDRGGSTDPLQPPFYGYRFGVGTHYDLGGLETDEHARVISTDGAPIENLYAAGEVVGSFQGSFRVDGSGIGESLVFGRIAVKKPQLDKTSAELTP